MALSLRGVPFESGDFRGAMGIMVVYDMTDRESLWNAQNWMSEIYQHAETDVPVVLVGNKADERTRRQVSEEEGPAVADEIGARAHFHTSAQWGSNVDAAFLRLATEAFHTHSSAQLDDRGGEPVHLGLRDRHPGGAKKKKKGCC